MPRLVVASLALLIGATGPALSDVTVAHATPATASGTVVQYGDGHRGSQLARLVTTVDPATGDWVSRVTFTVPQTADNASDVLVNLTPVGQRLPTWNWTTYSDPAKAGGSEAPVLGQPFLPTAFNGVAFPVPGATVAFEPGNRTLVLRVVSESLVGVDPDVVRVSLNVPGREDQISTATAFLGPVAPKSTIKSAAKRLTVGRDRTVRVPLAALSRPADRRVAFYRGTTPIAVKTLPAKYFRRRVAVVRLSAKDADWIVRSKRTKLALRTWLANGSTSTDSAVVTVRRSGE